MAEQLSSALTAPPLGRREEMCHGDGASVLQRSEKRATRGEMGVMLVFETMPDEFG